VNATDDKVNSLLKQIFASNDQARSQVSGIVDGIKAAQQQLVTDPSKARDPQSLAYFNQYLDQQLGKVEQILEGAKVDGKKQAELLAALGDEYRKAAPGQDGSEGHSGSQGGTDQSGGGGQVGGGGGPGVDPGAGARVADPFAGLGGLGGLGGGDPLSSMLGPAMQALSSLPGVLGGAGSALPAGALGALGGQLGGRDGGGSDGFSDHDDHEGRHGESDFVDGGDHGGSGQNQGAGDPNSVGSTTQNNPSSAADQGQPQPGQQPPGVAAVPASTAGNSNLVIQMPDGSPVTATTAQHKGAVEAVMEGASVADGWKRQNVDMPPPGTPVTNPGDPSHLVPGEVAQYKSRDPVMYAGNGKIWLDGQLQPQSALPTGDFLGWLDPGALAGAPDTPGATVAAPVVSGSPVLTAANG
jgi:hypothetical protein